MNGHFTECEICGALGHKAKSCGWRDIEARLDPVGEFERKQRRTPKPSRVSLPAPILNSQSSPRFGS
jgi:hypothetical protein